MEQFPGDIGLPAKGDLPIPDYDHLPRYVIESRLGSLTGDDVQILLRHESRNRNRTPVLRLLSRRARDLRAHGHPTPPGRRLRLAVPVPPVPAGRGRRPRPLRALSGHRVGRWAGRWAPSGQGADTG